MPAHVTASPTPNPNAMKFTLDRRVTEGKSQTFSSAEAAQGNSLAERVFAIGGVTAVFLLNDFVTVSKAAEASWDSLAPAITEALASHFE